MKRHLSSLSIAIIVHIFIMVLLFSSYFYIATSQSKKKEECMCVQLSCFPEPKEIKNKKKIEKKVQKKIEKKVLKKVVEKVQKKTIQKPREIPKEKIREPKLEKIVAEEILKEEVTEETSSQIIQKVVVPSIIEKSSQKKYIDENLDKIIKLLQENLYYPRSARKRGIVGEVIVQFTLLKDASVKNIIIVSSKREILSRAAQRTIEDLSGKFPKPKEKMILHIPIRYSLVIN
ncbi:energy transducer TonB [Sulfurimonas sp.]|jgi:periplasmic protein TonB|uniref:energy transducer TonB n=1 Tax=Sulfurimonas sp. TaxID=2022749 RepID=UPI0025E50BEE|nr:TonB family protein [Sulfurimonas sp.]MBT5935433.1 energy transducer TonB [Sulfurimonas sp.]